MPIIAPIDVFTMDAYVRLEHAWMSEDELPPDQDRRLQQEVYLMVSFMSALRCARLSERVAVRAGPPASLPLQGPARQQQQRHDMQAPPATCALHAAQDAAHS